mmetsp:Transcript_3655/g.6711  ORF Transcript_3655/g.6711 Transcript_3655/m.6711 type:complete len:292 (-) Transcript_3655:8-883(-)
MMESSLRVDEKDSKMGSATFSPSYGEGQDPHSSGLLIETAVEQNLPTQICMTTLDELARRHRTDKSGRYHNYAQFYDRLFSRLRSQSIKLLEIGIGTVTTAAPSSMNSYVRSYKPGASLRMWSDYFQNASLIAGIDTQEDCIFQEGRIRTALADSRCAESVGRAMLEFGEPRFDIIIDDGLHERNAQLETFECMRSYLAPDGVYLIEDIRRPTLLIKELRASLPSHTLHLEPLSRLRQNKKKIPPDSNVVVILSCSADTAAQDSVAQIVGSVLSDAEESAESELCRVGECN